MTTETIQPPTFHFLVENIFEWRTGDDLHTLMKQMDKHKHTYSVWYVPGEVTAQYGIKWYEPQVEGAFILQVVEYENGKRVVNQGEE